MRSVMTIAGSDSSGGAGIQADLKTIEAHKIFGTSAITALTAQNTMGVQGVEEVSPAFVGKQIDVVFEDIRPDAVKVGMVSSPENVQAIRNALVRNKAENVVVDPVMVATSGSSLIATDAVQALVDLLFPLAAVVTPNIPEAEVLADMEIASEPDMEIAAEKIAARVPGRAPAIMIKGGHGTGDPNSADDMLRLENGECVWLRGPRFDNPNTHGTGCTLSSAIACGLARGESVLDAVRSAKEYVVGAISANLNLGHGRGPLNHMWEYE